MFDYSAENRLEDATFEDQRRRLNMELCSGCLIDLALLSYHGTRTQQLARHRFNVRTSVDCHSELTCRLPVEILLADC
jgi:hypothetical protein